MCVNAYMCAYLGTYVCTYVDWYNTNTNVLHSKIYKFYPYFGRKSACNTYVRITKAKVGIKFVDLLVHNLLYPAMMVL